jgi:hypothetical protein
MISSKSTISLTKELAIQYQNCFINNDFNDFDEYSIFLDTIYILERDETCINKENALANTFPINLPVFIH